MIGLIFGESNFPTQILNKVKEISPGRTEQIMQQFLFDLLVPKVSENTWEIIGKDSKGNNLYVVGDSINAWDMPKSAFSANSQAKVAANHIRGSLTGSKVFTPRFANTCWSLVATNDGIKVGASYKATAEKIDKTSGFISKKGEDSGLRKATYEESIGWYEGITTDMFS